MTSERAEHVAKHLEEVFDRIARKEYEGLLRPRPYQPLQTGPSAPASGQIFPDKPPLEEVPLVEGDLPAWSDEEMQLTEAQ